MKQQINSNLIHFGEDLLDTLKKNRFLIEAAFWLYFSDADELRLVLASPLADQEGPKVVYSYIYDMLPKKTNMRISLQNISIISPNDHLIKALKKLKGEVISNIELNNLYIDGEFIEQIYIYFLSKVQNNHHKIERI